jgi:hypothetical protein
MSAITGILNRMAIIIHMMCYSYCKMIKITAEPEVNAASKIMAGFQIAKMKSKVPSIAENRFVKTPNTAFNVGITALTSFGMADAIQLMNISAGKVGTSKRNVITLTSLIVGIIQCIMNNSNFRIALVLLNATLGFLWNEQPMHILITNLVCPNSILFKSTSMIAILLEQNKMRQNTQLRQMSYLLAAGTALLAIRK